MTEDKQDTIQMELEKKAEAARAAARRFVIRCPGGVSGTTVEIDGVPVHGIADIEFGHEAGDTPIVRLTLRPREVFIEGSATVERTVICPCCREKQAESVATCKALADKVEGGWTSLLGGNGE